jgi:hypothetical protein
MNNMYFIETSAKDCSNVDKLFQEIARELIQVRIFFYFNSFCGEKKKIVELVKLKNVSIVFRCFKIKTMRNQRQETSQARQPGNRLPRLYVSTNCIYFVSFIGFDYRTPTPMMDPLVNRRQLTLMALPKSHGQNPIAASLDLPV